MICVLRGVAEAPRCAVIIVNVAHGVVSDERDGRRPFRTTFRSLSSPSAWRCSIPRMQARVQLRRLLLCSFDAREWQQFVDARLFSRMTRTSIPITRAFRTSRSEQLAVPRRNVQRQQPFRVSGFADILVHHVQRSPKPL